MRLYHYDAQNRTVTWYEKLSASEVLYDNDYNYNYDEACTISTNDERIFVVGGGEVSSDNFGKVNNEVILAADVESENDELERVCFELEPRCELIY